MKMERDFSEKREALVVTPPGSLQAIPDAAAGKRAQVHMIGIGGSGMSALAKVFVARGIEVSGSDSQMNGRIRDLISQGVHFVEGQGGGGLPNCGVVIRSAAIDDDNGEVLEAKRRGISVIKYASALGDLMGSARGIAIAGTHGKTTTTSMTAWVFSQLGKDPTYVIGGEARQLGGSAKSGQGPHMIAEACEFDRSFLKLRPRMAIVTNIEADHLDYYKDLQEIQDAFRHFVRLLPFDGVAVINGDDRNCRPLLRDTAAKVVTFGLEQGKTWQAIDLELRPEGASCRLLHRGKMAGRIKLRLSGVHNIMNALAVIALSQEEGLPLAAVTAALESFEGVDRRIQLLADRDGLAVIDDYAHHPTEVSAVLKAIAERYPHRRRVAVFQAHQHSRTRMLFDGFRKALSLADEVVLPDIYTARDNPYWQESVSALDLVDALSKDGTKARYIPAFSDLVEKFSAKDSDLRGQGGTVAVFMGAGDLTTAAHALAKRLTAA